jgi:chromosomal replication initiation ATPase DnaA
MKEEDLNEFIAYLNKYSFYPSPQIIIDFLKMKAKQKTLTDKIIEIVCKRHHTTIERIRTGGRKRVHTEPKQIICYFLIKTAKKTAREIGDIVGCKHCNVLASKKAALNFIDTDYNYAEKIEQLEKLIEKL